MAASLPLKFLTVLPAEQPSDVFLDVVVGHTPVQIQLVDCRPVDEPKRKRKKKERKKKKKERKKEEDKKTRQGKKGKETDKER